MRSGPLRLALVRTGAAILAATGLGWLSPLPASALDSHDTDRTAPANPTTNICPDPPQGGAMYNWLCDDLAATAQDWIISFWHHPPYTKGSHNSDTDGDVNDHFQIVKGSPLVPALPFWGLTGLPLLILAAGWIAIQRGGRRS